MKKGRYDPTADEGVHTVGRIFSKDFGWIFRPQPIADLGIDAHVEVCKGGEPLGMLIALQIKSGESYFTERSDEGYVYRGSLRHLKYWINHPLPVVLMLYDPTSEQVYWQAILPENVKTTRKGWKVVVPSNQRLERAALPHLSSLAEKGIDDFDTDLAEIVEEDFEDLPTDSMLPAIEVVGTKKMEVLRDKFVQDVSEQVESLTRSLWHREISLRIWQAAIARTIKDVFILQYALGKGCFDLMTKSDYDRLSGILRQQFKSLHVFASDIAKGRYKQEDIQEVIERSKLYIDYSLLAFEMGRGMRGDFDSVYIKTDDGLTVQLQKK
jgi:hypothetical protein